MSARGDRVGLTELLVELRADGPLGHRAPDPARGLTLLDTTLSSEDARRASATLDRLRRAGLDGAVTGGIAIAWHASPGAVRPLHDLDLVVSDLGSVPDRLGCAFEIRHVHADARPGRMLVQARDPATALRIDVFGAHGGTLSRCRTAVLRGADLTIVSREDLVARLGSLLLDLALDERVAPKHARDFGALVPRVEAVAMAQAWGDHRRIHHPRDFDEARAAVLGLVAARPDLLAEPVSPFRVSPCARCRPCPRLWWPAAHGAAPSPDAP